ncbi:LysR family transcriptional regulator [Segeticoccus rhizosphaerae]|jgi:DNA-binding transcriptional LysR family regulator|uniref:LysR family transcriptional regulator n=1 Tax=Segeticoccus rhizosphaerae TaxID=1104777 RepID=UPI0010C05A37|nr:MULTISPECIES: LysR family transcriptional regulator [Intrasporangiaceae]
MSEITLRQLEYFVAIADSGTLSGAATNCHVSQAAVSLALSDLERGLGVQLVIRRRAKGAAVTPAGRILAVRARRILSETLEFAAFGESLQGRLNGPMSVGCYSAYSSRVAPPLIQYFAEEHPAVSFDLVEGSSTDLQEALLSGRLDAVLILRGHVLPQVQFESVVEMRPGVLLPAGHRLAGQDAVSLADLQDESVILSAVRPADTFVLAMMQEVGVEPHVAWRSESTEAIRSMVGRGFGYAVLLSAWPGLVTQEGKALVFKPIAEDVPTNAFVLAYPRGTSLTEKHHILLDFCRSHFDPF